MVCSTEPMHSIWLRYTRSKSVSQCRAMGYTLTVWRLMLSHLDWPNFMSLICWCTCVVLRFVTCFRVNIFAFALIVHEVSVILLVRGIPLCKKCQILLVGFPRNTTLFRPKDLGVQKYHLSARDLSCNWHRNVIDWCLIQLCFAWINWSPPALLCWTTLLSCCRAWNSVTLSVF